MGTSTKSFSKEQEKRIAKDMQYANGKTQPGSGAINVTGLKHDVKTSRSSEWDVLVEAKTSMVKPGQAGKRSMKFEKAWIKDVQTHAIEMGKAMGVVAFSFDNQEDFYTLGKQDFLNMHQAVMDYEDIIDGQKAQIKDLEFLLSMVLFNIRPMPNTEPDDDATHWGISLDVTRLALSEFLKRNPKLSILESDVNDSLKLYVKVEKQDESIKS